MMVLGMGYVCVRMCIVNVGLRVWIVSYEVVCAVVIWSMIWALEVERGTWNVEGGGCLVSCR